MDLLDKFAIKDDLLYVELKSILKFRRKWSVYVTY